MTKIKRSMTSILKDLERYKNDETTEGKRKYEQAKIDKEELLSLFL